MKMKFSLFFLPYKSLKIGIDIAMWFRFSISRHDFCLPFLSGFFTASRS